MTKSLIFSGSKLNYEEIEEDRKSFSITIFPSGKLVFKTPLQATILERKRFLIRKTDWINRQRAYFKQFNIKKQSFVSGSDIFYLGRRYQLIVKEECPERVAFAANKVIVYSKGAAEILLSAFMRKRAEYIFAERLGECLKLFPEFTSYSFIIKIRKMAKRWGSYHSKGTIFLNPELIKAPKRCIDYVIIHELCHEIHKNHNKAFFKLLEQKVPDYKDLKTELEVKYNMIKVF